MAPAGLRQPIVHEWRRDGRVVTRVALPTPVLGGRSAGFRTHSRRADFEADSVGRWSVDVVTASGSSSAACASRWSRDAPLLFDTHAHLHDPAFAADRDAALARARAAGVARILTVGTDPASARDAVALAAAHPEVYAAVGIHPHDAAAADDEALAAIAALARAPKVVAIGEIGLDYYRNLSPRDAQQRALRAQLALARELAKPVLLHCREAHADLLALLDAEGVGAGRGDHALLLGRPRGRAARGRARASWSRSPGR